MGFLGDGAIGHGPCLKPLYNGLHTLHLIYGNPALFVKFEIKDAPQVHGLPLLIEGMGVFFKNMVISRSGGLLQQVDGEWVIQMLFLSRPPFVASHAV